MRRPGSCQRGFTLVEMLVALFITAIMFTLGYRALSQALTGRKQTDEQAARLLAVQTAMRTLAQDFELLAPRPVRDVLGDGYLPALTTSLGAAIGQGAAASSTLGASSSSTLGVGGSLGSSSSTLGSSNGSGDLTTVGAPSVTFTRVGWTNPAGIERSELQRVYYSVQNDSLQRQYWPVLDATASVQVVTRTLLEHVKSFSVRFLDAGHQWQTQWPETALGQTAQQLSLRARPIAVEVTLELDDWGTLVRVIEVPG